jgi:hypothetical protein
VEQATLWCPSCGAEYEVGSTQCRDCRVALVNERPPGLDDDEGDDDGDGDLVALGEWPKVQAQVLRRRLDSAGVPVMIEWSNTPGDQRGVLLIPNDQFEFGTAVVNEIDVDDEVADDSPHAYVARIEEHLSAAVALMDELRTKLDELESDGKL